MQFTSFVSVLYYYIILVLYYIILRELFLCMNVAYLFLLHRLVAYDEAVLEYVSPQMFALNEPFTRFQVEVNAYIRAATAFTGILRAEFGDPLSGVSAEQTVSLVPGQNRVQLLVR